MALQRLSPEPDAFFNALQNAVEGLLYMSESDAPFKVSRFSLEQVGDRLSTTDIHNLFYPQQPSETPLEMEWALLERIDTNGYQNFFRHFVDYITQYSSGEIVFWTPDHRAQAAKFRALRDLFFDHLIHQRWIKVNLDGVNKAIFIGGLLVQIDFDTTTNGITTQPLEWFVVETSVVES